ncbi:MAG: HAMP domain-containing protein [Verrucomicrobia bacterium]|nr:HAMP domain-containing protein [Verrucomicrobiota bacterium]
MTSFRLRLALLAGTITAGLLLLAGYLAWNLTTRFNLDRLDRELHHLAKGNLVRVDDASHWGRLDAALAFVSGGDRPPLYVLWVKNYDRVEFRSPRWPEGIDPEGFAVADQYEDGVTFDRPPPPPRKAGLSRTNPPLPVREARFHTVSANGSTWRVAVSGNPYTKLVLAANLDESNLALQRLRGRFLAVLPLVLLVVGLGAWWLATRALRPVAALTRAAENITAHGLDQRIAAPAHDREFQRLVTVFNAMLDRLEQSFHQARRFSADASHELKTPLALLQAELEQALRAAPSGSPQQQLCSSLLDEIHRLKAILDKLLLLSLADSGRLALDRSPTDLSAILTNVIDDGTGLAPGLQFECVVPPGQQVQADAVLLEQALQNLVNNAVKYNRPGGLIRVALRTEAGKAVLTVGNSGPGIPPQDQARLFERFFRGDAARTRERTAGVGLGLSLSREILRAHGGDLVLGRSDGEWTEFNATLPLHGPATT